MKQSKPLSGLRSIAEEIVTALRPYSHRVEIAGSIRRGQPWVGDIEIVAIPKATIEPAPLDLFGDPMGEAKFIRDPGFVMVLDSLAKQVVKGNPESGKYIQIVLTTGDVLDLFTATPDNWGYIMAIRTGSADFMRAMAARWVQLGYNGKDGTLMRRGTKARDEFAMRVPEEIDLFNLLGLVMPLPSDREISPHSGLTKWIRK